MVKKASLNLSINAIVVLILAVTMLGLGLMFMKNMFGKSIKQLEDVSNDIKDQTIQRVKESNQKVAFLKEDVEIKRSETKEMYFGVLNELSEAQSFLIRAGCYKVMSTNPDGTPGDPTGVKFECMDSTIPLEKNEVAVNKLVIKAEPNALQSTYQCYIFVDPEITELTAPSTDPTSEGGSYCGSEGVKGSYYRKYFFVTVK